MGETMSEENTGNAAGEATEASAVPLTEQPGQPPTNSDLPNRNATVGRITGLGRTLSSVAAVGRDLLARRRQNQPAQVEEIEPVKLDSADILAGLCKALIRL